MVTKDTAEVAEDMLAKTKKSVEHNLTKIYRKLQISSRAELGRRMDQGGNDPAR